MQYREYISEMWRTLTEISVFEEGDKVDEYQLIIKNLDYKQSPFEEQLKALVGTLEEVKKMLFERSLQKTEVVFQRLFLSDAANQTSVLWKYLPMDKRNVSIVEQPPLDGSKVVLWAYLQTCVVWTESASDFFELMHGRWYTHLWQRSSLCIGEDSEWQMRTLLSSYVEQLGRRGCTLADNCIRTWIFVQNVDVNYAGVVKARREIFQEQGLTEKTHYIASTGIGGRHENPMSLVLFDAYAIRGLKPGQVNYLYAKSHLSPTFEYGITFERGVCVNYGDRRHVFISGTASIDNKGKIVHEGDIRLQTMRMIENVGVLLDEAGCSFGDIAYLIVYLRDIADYSTVKEIIYGRFQDVPKAIVFAPVCRRGWLVEMECMAIRQDYTYFGIYEPL